MPIGTKKPVVKNAAGGNRILMPQVLGDASIAVSGSVFAASYNNSPERIYKWSDPTQTSVYSVADLPFGTNLTGTKANCIAYDTTNTKLYVGYTPNDNGTDWVVDIASVDPSTLSSTMLVNEYVLFADSSNIPDANNGIATDGTSIFYAYGPGDGTNVVILKFACSNGAFVSSLTLPNTGTGGTITSPRTLTALGGSLYITGAGPSSGYAAKVALDFSSSTTISTGLLSPCDDIAITSTYIWEGDEATSRPGSMCRTALDMSTTTLFTIPAPAPKAGIGWVDATYYDGTYLWVSLIQDQSNVGNPSQLVKIDEATFSVVQRYVPGVVHLNEIQAAGTGFWMSSFSTNTITPSMVQYSPIP